MQTCFPPVAHFFAHPFPFFAVPPKQLDVQKEGMLYMDFDHGRSLFVSLVELFDTRDRFHQIDTAELISEGTDWRILKELRAELKS